MSTDTCVFKTSLPGGADSFIRIYMEVLFPFDDIAQRVRVKMKTVSHTCLGLAILTAFTFASGKKWGGTMYL